MMFERIYLVYVIYIFIFLENCTYYCVGSSAPGDTIVPTISGSGNIVSSTPGTGRHSHGSSSLSIGNPSPPSSVHIEAQSSYAAKLSDAIKQAVSNEYNSPTAGTADGACNIDDLECLSVHDRFGMEAIRSLHQQLDDDENGNIDLSESNDFLREELKYDSGYEKRHKAFHYNDDMHISVKELWEAWLRSEVHNWTIEQTTDWLAESVQLPQYVELFKQHKVTGATLPRLAVNNMYFVGNVLGIKDPIHKQKIALKAMDVVLFGPPRETGTRWKDYILITLLLSAIIGCWYAYQQNKSAKRHLKRMAQDMEGLQKAEQALQEMQKELERARMEQENVATEKLDLERRLKEAPSISSSSSDLELQQLKQEIEMLRSELSRAEVELVDHCWSPPTQLQPWLQYTYELESKNHLKKRISAEKQLQQAREACEKLKKKRSSLVGAFVSTHGKSIDDVDRSIVEARNSLGEVTNELQERLHRWKQIELLLGFNIVNNNGLAYLENTLYSRNGSGKSSRGRITNSTDDLDDDSAQGLLDNHGKYSSSGMGGYYRDDSSNSDEGDNQMVTFFVGGSPTPILMQQHSFQSTSSSALSATNSTKANNDTTNLGQTIHNSHHTINSGDSLHNHIEDNRHSPSQSSERSINIPPRGKKSTYSGFQSVSSGMLISGRAPLPPPRRGNSSHQGNCIVRSQSTDTVPMDYTFNPVTNYYQSSTVCSSQPISKSNIPESSQFNTIGMSGNILPSATSSPTTNITTASHGDTQIEDTNSTDSSSLDDELKKRRRKLHFPFGKKSNKSKLA